MKWCIILFKDRLELRYWRPVDHVDVILYIYVHYLGVTIYTQYYVTKEKDKKASNKKIEPMYIDLWFVESGEEHDN